MYCQFNMTRLEPNLKIPVMSPAKPSAVVIGAGLGGLSAAMRLGSKGYSVTVVDRLDRVGGRGSSVSRNGFRFDLGPTILTVPQVFEKLWQDCGREFAADVDLVPLDPFYEIRWQDGTRFQVRSSEKDMLAEVSKNFPKDLIITAKTKNNTIMGLMHKNYNIHGFQFHPESINTKVGIKLIKNFINN